MNTYFSKVALCLCMILPFLAFSEDAMDPTTSPEATPSIDTDSTTDTPRAKYPAQRYRPLFDSKNLLSFKGVVEDVTEVAHPTGKSSGVHVTVKSEDKTYLVLLGPSWYMQEIGLNVETGNRIEVTGSLVESNGDNVVIPASINLNNQNFVLRDQQGIPAWRGRGLNPNY